VVSTASNKVPDHRGDRALAAQRTGERGLLRLVFGGAEDVVVALRAGAGGLQYDCVAEAIGDYARQAVGFSVHQPDCGFEWGVFWREKLTSAGKACDALNGAQRATVLNRSAQ
jgi:hypothetical protein